MSEQKIFLFKDFPAQILALDFEDKRKLLLPSIYFCVAFFFLYYTFLIVPKFGTDSVVFIIDNIGGLFIISGFIVSYFLSRVYKNHFVLFLPSFMSVFTTSLFLLHQPFYESVDHLWISSQIIGIIFSIYLGSPKWNVCLFILNALVPPLIGFFSEHLSPTNIIYKQAIVYYASVISIYLSYRVLEGKSELALARDKAINTEAFKSQFLANMSHELRTPMNGVLGSLQLLEREPLNHKQQQLLCNGISSSKLLLCVLNDILDISKLESRQLKLDIKSENIILTIEEAVREMSYLAAEKKLSLNFKYDLEMEQFWQFDSLRLKQIMLNLISNAVKFTEQGQVSVNLSQKTTNLEISVSDTGIGMSEDFLQQIFQRFTQAEPSTSKQYGGTGLGTAICFEIVSLMNGQIEVTSELGKGSTFIVSLPLQVSQTHDVEQVKEQDIKVPNGEGLTTLIAEDNMINYVVFEAMMSPTNTHILFAKDGVEAIDLFSKSHVDIIFLDIQMPNMDGIEACKAIREVSKNIPIIAITANLFEDDIRKYEEVGFDGYLSKPLDMQKLYDLYASFIHQSRAN